MQNLKKFTSHVYFSVSDWRICYTRHKNKLRKKEDLGYRKQETQHKSKTKRILGMMLKGRFKENIHSSGLDSSQPRLAAPQKTIEEILQESKTEKTRCMLNVLKEDLR